jgi:GT2 family glycosyltransferase
MRATAETAVIDVELSSPLRDRTGLDSCTEALVYLRLHGEPIGSTRLPVTCGRLSADDLARRIIDEHAGPIAFALARRAALRRDLPARFDARRLLTHWPDPPTALPLVTVAVCTRERPESLEHCLDSLLLLDYPNLDLVVIDNAPKTDATERVVRRYSRVRYVREPRPGLDWARNRAIVECRGEILAYTDDDVIVDSGWISALARVFAADPDVMAVTGLVVPHELATRAQRLFETYGGFGRGFTRTWYRAAAGRPVAPEHGGAGRFGTGANMAYRRRLFDLIGGFDPALDVGTCTNGGGDLDMFFRVLKEGYTLVYEPAAIVRHVHRREYPQLRTQIVNNGIGFYSFLVKTALTYADERVATARLGAWWFRWWSLRRLARSLARKEELPRELITGELFGSLRGLVRYQRARKHAERIAAEYAGEPIFVRSVPVERRTMRRLREGVRKVDIAQPLEPITDAHAYERLRMFVSWRGKPIGAVVIEHHGATISALRLSDAIAHQLSGEILATRTRIGSGALWSRLVADLVDHFAPQADDTLQSAPDAGRTLSPQMSASVVVATRDRPDDLRRCLEALVAQHTSRRLELIVVDNNPASGITRRVVEQFPTVRLVEERRGGLSYARNAGILSASGDIIATTDDDAVCAPDWVERLVAPFSRADVMIVTGNVLPIELETEAQRMFEWYGGLSRGFKPFDVDGNWFSRWRRAVPTWELGCTANAAFRACIFSNPDIGLMDEALGAGTPTGCSEDTYHFYRVLKAGYAIVYEPDAFVWHRHRDTMRALRHQIYSYSKGHVAYQLTTWLNDGDRRALVRLFYELPRIYLLRSWYRVRGYSDYPLGFIALEVLGILAGPWALWKSRRRVRRLGRSGVATPPSDVAAPRAA